MKVLFTDTLLRGLRSRNQRYMVMDSKRRGLALRVSPDGTKTFVVSARERTGERRLRMMTLGPLKDVSLADAREKANEVFNRLGWKQGHPQADVIDSRRRAKNATTVAKLLELYVRSREQDLAAITATEYRRISSPRTSLTQWGSRTAIRVPPVST